MWAFTLVLFSHLSFYPLHAYLNTYPHKWTQRNREKKNLLLKRKAAIKPAEARQSSVNKQLRKAPKEPRRILGRKNIRKSIWKKKKLPSKNKISWSVCRKKINNKKIMSENSNDCGWKTRILLVMETNLRFKKSLIPSNVQTIKSTWKHSERWFRCQGKYNLIFCGLA